MVKTKKELLERNKIIRKKLSDLDNMIRSRKITEEFRNKIHGRQQKMVNLFK